MREKRENTKGMKSWGGGKSKGQGQRQCSGEQRHIMTSIRLKQQLVFTRRPKKTQMRRTIFTIACTP